MGNDVMTMYCDVTWAQFNDLVKLSKDPQHQMHGARRQALKDLVGPDGLTEMGYEVVQRGMNELKIDPVYVLDTAMTITRSPSSIANRMRKQWGWEWFRSVHAKVMITLGIAPMQCYRHLCDLYGYQTVNELVEAGLIEGKKITGGQFFLSVIGRGEVIHWAQQ